MQSYNISDYIEKGSKDENKAMRIVENVLRGKCIKTSVEIDRFCHTDFFWVTEKCVLCSIDKKMLKKVKREDGAFSANATWIELIGVTGHRGSACCQTDELAKYGFDIDKINDYLMIETPVCYLFVQRYKLEEMAMDKIAGKEVSRSNPCACDIPYQRKGRKDLIVMISFEDLEKISQFKIKK